MARMSLVLTLMSLGMGCTVPEQDFPETYAREHCKKSQRCDRDRFDDVYDDRDDCIAGVERGMEASLAIGDFFADYDDQAGWECIREIETSSCEAFLAGEHNCGASIFD